MKCVIEKNLTFMYHLRDLLYVGENPEKREKKYLSSRLYVFLESLHFFSALTHGTSLFCYMMTLYCVFLEAKEMQHFQENRLICEM